jgi:hypothetical protein
VRGVIRSAATGALLALLAGILVFVLGSQTAAVTAFLEPGIIVGGFLSPFAPRAMTYWAEPEGGPYAFLFIVLFCAFLFWSTLLGRIHFFCRRAQRHHSVDASR